MIRRNMEMQLVNQGKKALTRPNRFFKIPKALQGKNGLGGPQFPGGQTGLDIEQVRSIIKKQKRCRGYAFAVASGQNEFDLDLSGSARVLLGFALQPDDVADITAMASEFTWNINEEIVIDRTHPSFYTNTWMDDEYFMIMRPLGGTDQLSINFNNPNADQTWRMIVYYL